MSISLNVHTFPISDHRIHICHIALVTRATNKKQLFLSSLKHSAFEWHWNTSIAEVKHCHHPELSLCWECVLDDFVITGNSASPSMTWGEMKKKCVNEAKCLSMVTEEPIYRKFKMTCLNFLV